MRKCKQLVMAAASAAASMVTGQALAVTSEWTGAGPQIAGSYNTTTPSPTNVNYQVWDTLTAGNWVTSATPTAYTAGNDVVFNAATGNFIIASNNSLNPNAVTFTGGASYDFTRASTAGNGSSNFAGWTGFTSTSIAGADSFSSSAFYNASAPATFSINIGTATSGEGAFTGTVIFRTRAAALTAYGGTTLNSGTLEIHDVGSLPAVGSNINAPSLWVNGGTFNVNIDTGTYTFRVNNTSPASNALAGILTFAGNATLGNTAVDIYGRAREQNNLWNGNVTIASGVTLTVNTGGGTAIGANVAATSLQGAGTIVIGADAGSLPGGINGGANRLRLSGNFGTANAGIRFNLGDNGILENGVALNGTTNLGALSGGANSILRGSNANPSTTVNHTSIAIGATGESTQFLGVIGNGWANGTGSGSGSGTPPTAAKLVTNTAITKNGAGSLLLAGKNYYGGGTTVAAGKLILGSNHAIGGGAAAVNIASGATLDFNGNSQIAGRQYVVNGGSLVNDGAAPVTINTGAGGTFTHNGGTGTVAASSGVWSGAGSTPSVSITGGGGTGATAQVILQLGWLRFSEGGGVGSGYTKEPIITFSAPELPGGRTIKAVASLNNAGNGQVAGVNIIDPGYGYTSVPTMTIDSTGTGGTGFVPAFSMTAAGIVFTDGGTGYTSAPTITLGGTGYHANTSATIANFGQVQLAATSRLGGSGAMTIQPGITGAGGLIKAGTGVLTLAGTNSYAGGTTIEGGTLAVSGTLAMTGASVLQTNITAMSHYGKFASETGSTVTLDGTLNINLTETYTDSHIDWKLFTMAGNAPVEGFDAINLTGSYVAALTEAVPGLWTVTIGADEWSFNEASGILHVPEPSSLALIGLIGGGLLSRRRRKA